MNKIKKYAVESSKIIAEEGVLQWIEITAHRIKERCVTRNEADWFHRDLREIVEPIIPKRAVSMVDLGEREISPWLKEHSAQFRWIYQPKESEIGQREQHVFPTVQDKGHIIGYIKVGVNRVYVHDFDEIIELPRNTAMIYDTLILPEYRGHGIASFMITETVRLLRQRGFDNLWCHIPPWNIPSIRAYSRAGFRRVAHVKFMRFLKWQFYSGDVQAVMEEAQRKVRRLRSGGRDLQAG